MISIKILSIAVLEFFVILVGKEIILMLPTSSNQFLNKLEMLCSLDLDCSTLTCAISYNTSNTSDNAQYCLPRCEGMQYGRCLLTFSVILLTPSSRSYNKHTGSKLAYSAYICNFTKLYNITSQKTIVFPEFLTSPTLD
jgi:hypothetical protein